MEPIVLRVSEAAPLLGISRSKAYELVSSKTIPSIRIGGSVRVPVDALKAWVEAQAAAEQVS